MARYPVYLEIREIKVEITVWCIYRSIRIAEIKKTVNIQVFVGETVEQELANFSCKGSNTKTFRLCSQEIKPRIYTHIYVYVVFIYIHAMFFLILLI